MSEPSPANGKASMGVQAYRWLTVGCMGILTALSYRVLDQIDKTAAKVDLLQIQVVTLSGTAESRINAHAQRLDTVDRRNDSQDVKINEVERRVWQLAPPRATP